MAELERQASISESPDSKPVTDTEAARRSITSSALTSLLPIAAASGIVRPNYNTPKISFYSPSGSLIQPEGSSSPETSAWEYGSAPTAPTLYPAQPRRSPLHQTLPATACLPPARPTLVPMTTPPTSTAPLPPHLQHHHNYRRPERSQISSREWLIDPTPTAKGCGGVVRSHSVTPRSHTRQSHHKKIEVSSRHHRRRSTRSIFHDLKSDANFYKSRYIASAIQSCSTSGTSKKHTKRTNRRHTAGVKARPSTHAHAYPGASKPCSKRAAKPVTKTHTTHKTKDTREKGSLAGHALRICFCQPYDGAGKRTPKVGSCTSKDHAMHAGLEKVRDRRGEGEGDNEPATRVVGSAKHQQQGATRSSSSAKAYSRRRSDSAVSGLRVKTVGV
jgi:hypothetical protein